MALKDQPYLPLYVMDFMTDEKLSECSAESTGVYIWLLCLLHKSDPYGTILLRQKDKQTDKQISNFALKIGKRMPFSIEVIERSLTELVSEDVIQIDGDALSQKRMLRDYEISQKRSIAGGKGGSISHPKQKYSKSSSKIQANEKANQQANSENEIEYESENEIDNNFNNERTKNSKSQSERVDERFAQFWAAYPRKKDKGGAERAWKKINPTQELFDKIMAALEYEKAHDDQWRKDNGQFIPYPATWLNGKRWEDDCGSPKAVSAAPTNFDPENPYADWGDSDE